MANLYLLAAVRMTQLFAKERLYIDSHYFAINSIILMGYFALRPHSLKVVGGQQNKQGSSGTLSSAAEIFWFR